MVYNYVSHCVQKCSKISELDFTPPTPRFLKEKLAGCIFFRWRGKGTVFFFRGKVWVPTNLLVLRIFLFFFRHGKKNSQYLAVFFFPLEKFTPYLLTQIRGREKKTCREKKKTAVLPTNSIFPKKCTNLNFSWEINKYGTFGRGD